MGTVIVRPDDYPIRMLEIVDRGAFAQEFWIRDDRDVYLRPEIAEDTLNLVACTNGNCRLGNDYSEVR